MDISDLKKIVGAALARALYVHTRDVIVVTRDQRHAQGGGLLINSQNMCHHLNVIANSSETRVKQSITSRKTFPAQQK